MILGAVFVTVGVGLLAKLGSSQMSQAQVKKDSVLTINLQGEIDEISMPVGIDYSSLLSGNLEKKQSLNELTQAI